MVLSLTEDFEMMRSRHPARIKMRTGAKADGTLVAREHIALLDCGAYADDSPAVVSVCCLFGRGPYTIPNYRGRADGVYTNKLRAGAFRGFGGPQATFASESQLDELAAKLRMHPVDFAIEERTEQGREICRRPNDPGVGVYGVPGARPQRGRRRQALVRMHRPANAAVSDIPASPMSAACSAHRRISSCGPTGRRRCRPVWSISARALTLR